MNVDVSELAFPIIAFFGKEMLVYRAEGELTHTTRAALRGGLYTSLDVCDSSGRHVVVRGAQKLRGIGPLAGWNIFLNQRIEVKLDLECHAKNWSLSEIKQRVRREMQSWKGWSSRDDFSQLRDSVDHADSIRAIISTLAAAV